MTYIKNMTNDELKSDYEALACAVKVRECLYKTAMENIGAYNGEHIVRVMLNELLRVEVDYAHVVSEMYDRGLVSTV